MARKAAKEAAKKKAAKQRKMLIVLALALVGAGVFAFTTLSKLHSSSAPHVAGTTAPAATPAGSQVDTPAPTETPVSFVTPGIGVPPSGSVRVFTALGRKDPFNDDGPKPKSDSSTSNSGSSTPNSASSTPTSKPKIHDVASKPKKTTRPLRRAVIALNGKNLTVVVGAKFGHAPGSTASLFKLLKVSATRVVIGVVGTQLQYTLNIQLPEKLTQAGSDTTYTLILERVKTARRH